jgi:hypothetical protein
MYFLIWGGVQLHSFLGSVKYPQGQGFIAATNINRAGKLNEKEARETRTRPSSMGWRRTSSTCLGNSGSSSKKSTPLCAILTSPGLGCLPPPINAICKTVSQLVALLKPGSSEIVSQCGGIKGFGILELFECLFVGRYGV